MQPMTHRGEEIAVQPTPMSMNYSNSDKTYRIATKVSAGTIEDPITGEKHKIESHDDRRGGVIEVARPDSAQYIVDGNSRAEFVGTGPSEQAVEEAQLEEFDFAGSEVCESFAAKRGETMGSQTLDPAVGFDPKSGDVINDKRLKVFKVYEQLQSDGYDDEAGYLRALPSVDTQDDFAGFVLEQGLVAYE